MSKLFGKRFKLILIIVIIVVALITCGIVVFLIGIGATDPGNEDDVAVTVESGAGASTIVEELDEKGLVKNKTCAKVLARVGGYKTLQANTYVFNKSMTLTEILKAINTGDFDYVSKNKFTLVEGATLPDAAKAIAEETSYSKNDIISAWADETYLNELIDEYWFLTDEILADGIMYPLEGYLYPDSYFVTDENVSIQDITKNILDTTDKELTKRKSGIEGMDMTVHQFLTLASIVESESLFDKDRSKIAGVFINRLHEDMPLQSDITVLYALQEKRVEVTYDDLEVDSEYNTYQNTGLPIGPVSSVQGATMDDVINYEKSDYLYFFAKEDGEVIYSKTAEEHEKAVSENEWY